MNNIRCLNELEQPITYHSHLLHESKDKYCVLAENCLIIFQVPADIISLFRVPLNKGTKLKFKDTEFTVTIQDISFVFSDKNSSVIKLWKEHLDSAIRADIRDVVIDCHADMVQIDKIKKDECPMVIDKTGYRLFIYESYNYQRVDICRHVINLRFYKPDYNATEPEKKLTLKGTGINFKFTFKTIEMAVKWNEIFRNCLQEFLHSQAEKTVLCEIYKNPPNRFCADCGAAEPQWVSINICVTLCDNCVGQHRQLGTGISRTNSILMDNKCWQDGQLVALLTVIGNDAANRFWLCHPPKNGLVTVASKYRDKQFIDGAYNGLSADDIIQRLSRSVMTDNVTETMRLWFGSNADFSAEIVDQLLTKAVKSNQKVQEKFLRLQETKRSSPPIEPSIFEGVFKMSLNSDGKMTNLFLLSLYANKFVVRIENPNILCKDNIDVCTVGLANIRLAYWNNVSNSFQLSFSDHCRFVKGSCSVNITTLTITDSSLLVLKALKNAFFNSLITCATEPATDDTSLFLVTDIGLNGHKTLQQTVYLTKHELILTTPFCKYDLTKLCELTLAKDKPTVTLVIANDDISLEMTDNGLLVYTCLYEASIIRLVSIVDNDRILNKLIKLIEFIKIFGYNCNNIFVTDGEPRKVEQLFHKLLSLDEKLCINSNEFSPYDGASCLKRCLSLLSEPLISEALFRQFKLAAYTDNDDEKAFSYKKTLNSFRMFANYKLLNSLMELLFFIAQVADFNELTIKSLCDSFGHLVLPNNGDNDVDNRAILAYFIRHFVTLFDYPEECQLHILIFNDKTNLPKKLTVLKKCCINHGLIGFKKPELVADAEPLKLKWFDNLNDFRTVTLVLNDLPLVADVFKFVFNNVSEKSVQLWHVIFVKDKVFKRLFYYNDKMAETIDERYQFPDSHKGGKKMDYLVFLPNENTIETTAVGISFQCQVKINNAKYNATISRPNELRLTSLSTSRPIYEFILSEMNLYRGHQSTTFKVYLLRSDLFIDCEFRNCEDYRAFLLYFDKCRSIFR